MGTRRKIEIEKLIGKDKIAVTCSKRRVGLYNKITDLCILSDAKAALFVATPGNPSAFYSFGCPFADEVANAFLENRLPSGRIPSSVYSDYHMMKDVKKKIQKAELERSRKRKRKDTGFWWEVEDFEECETIEDISHLIDQLTKLKNNVSAKLKKIETSDTAKRDSDKEGLYPSSYHHSEFPKEKDHRVDDHNDDLSILYSLLDKDDGDMHNNLQGENNLNDFMVDLQQLISSPSSNQHASHGLGEAGYDHNDASAPRPLSTPEKNTDHIGDDKKVHDWIFDGLEMITDLKNDCAANRVEPSSPSTSNHITDPSNDSVHGFQTMEAALMPDYPYNEICDSFYFGGGSSSWSALNDDWDYVMNCHTQN